MAKSIYFPDILQNSNFSCGNACVQAVLAYYGIEYTETKLIKVLKTSCKWGTKSKNMIEFFKEKNFKVKHGSFTQQDLKDFINKGIPVIILLQAWGPSGTEYEHTNQYGHYIVVSGYNKRGFLIEDPAIFGRAFLSYAQLKKRWHAEDEGKIFNWGLAIWGKSVYDYSKPYRMG
jgi:ABC-type bacteriocin/lantibiotic exporter with double-glycine peptidase domain